jgi:hypothetical protein
MINIGYSHSDSGANGFEMGNVSTGRGRHLCGKYCFQIAGGP